MLYIDKAYHGQHIIITFNTDNKKNKKLFFK